MKISHLALLLLGVGGALAGAVELFHPEGLLGAAREWSAAVSGSGAKSDADPGTSGAPKSPTGDPAGDQAPVAGRSNAVVIAAAEACAERGDFDGATSNYMAARSLAGNSDERAAAIKGLDRSVILWAAVQRPPRGSAGAKAESELTALVQKAESAPSEQAWFDALRLAAGARLNDRLAYIASNLLDCVKRDGPVERQCLAVIPDAGPRADSLALALTKRGLGAGGYVPSASGDGTGSEFPDETSGIGVKPPQDETSGIRGSGRRSVPFGSFSAATRELLAKAADWETEGRQAYADAAPSHKDRVENAKKCVHLLQQAREVYVAALDEDPKASGLEARVREITRMISDTKKSLPVGTYK